MLDQHGSLLFDFHPPLTHTDTHAQTYMEVLEIILNIYTETYGLNILYMQVF